jgi:hypothetical protein
MFGSAPAANGIKPTVFSPPSLPMNAIVDPSADTTGDAAWMKWVSPEPNSTTPTESVPTE